MSGSNGRNSGNLAAKWRRAAYKILETVERGDAQRLEDESPEDFVNTLTTAAGWGLTFAEVSREDTWREATPVDVVARAVGRLYRARVNPPGWVISRFVGGMSARRGEVPPSAAWRAEFSGCGCIIVSEAGDLDFGASIDDRSYPPWALLVRDVCEALKGLDGEGSKAVAS